MPISYRAAQHLIKRGDEPALQAALDAGLDPNAKNENGWTLLMLAAVEGSASAGSLLLNRGADPTLQNTKSETALTIATHRGHIDFVELLNDASS